MRRRDFIKTIAGSTAAWPLAARAQSSGIRPIVAMLSVAENPSVNSSFLAGLRDLSRIEGEDFRFIDRSAGGYLERLPDLAADLVRLKPDVIVAATSSVALPVARLTTTIPIVVAVMADEMGLITSDARPGGNVTGILINLKGLAGKQLQIAVDVTPGTKKVGLLFNSGNVGVAFQRSEFEAAASALGVTLVVPEVRSPDDLDAALQTLLAERVSIVVVSQDSMLTAQRRQIIALASAARLPVMAAFRPFAEDGALITYGINPSDNYRRAAVYVDKILKGAKAGDLPVELPTKLEMVINLKSAKVLGLAIPATLLTQADQVIE